MKWAALPPLRGSFVLGHKNRYVRDLHALQATSRILSVIDRRAGYSHSMVLGGFELMS
jgi:hypothetical protein